MKRYSLPFTIALFALTFCSANTQAAHANQQACQEFAARSQSHRFAGKTEAWHSELTRGPNIGMPQSVD